MWLVEEVKDGDVVEKREEKRVRSDSSGPGVTNEGTLAESAGMRHNGTKTKCGTDLGEMTNDEVRSHTPDERATSL